MSIFSIKEFLSLDEVGLYLNQNGFDFELEDEQGHLQLHAIVDDLVKENKLDVLVYYDGTVELKYVSNASSTNPNKTKTIQIQAQGYFKSKSLSNALNNSLGTVINGYYKPYKIFESEYVDFKSSSNEFETIQNSRDFFDQKEDSDGSPLYTYYLKCNEKARSNDLRFIKADLDNLFNKQEDCSSYNKTQELEDKLKIAREIYKEHKDEIKGLNEQITKLTETNDKNAPVIIIDEFGKELDLSELSKNCDDEYLTTSETLSYINDRADSDYDSIKLQDLVRKSALIPCFYFYGYVGMFSEIHGTDLYTELAAGYFTCRLLKEAVGKVNCHLELPSGKLEDGIIVHKMLQKQSARYSEYDDGVFLFTDIPKGFEDANELELKSINSNEIRFSKSNLDNYFFTLDERDDKRLPYEVLTSEPPTDDLNTQRNIDTLSSKHLSNTELQTIRRRTIKYFNRTLAMVMLQLDYKKELSKNDVVDFIRPYMSDLAMLLSEQNAEGANKLTVTNKTISDTHLQGLSFKVGRPKTSDTQKRIIELLFKRKLPDTE